MNSISSYEGKWVTTRIISSELNYSPVYFIQKAKKLERDGIFKNGIHFFKSGPSNSCPYQWNFSEVVKTFSEWRAPSKEVRSESN